MSRAKKPGLPRWAKAAGAVLGLLLALFLFGRYGGGRVEEVGPPPGELEARDAAYKEFAHRLDSYRSCRADADCVRVRPDCACTAVSKARLADYEKDRAASELTAGLSSCPDWPEPSCEDATSSPVCVKGECRVHVTLEDASWDQ